VHRKQAARVRKNPINTQPRGHNSTFFQAYVCWLFLFLAVLILPLVMQSLTTASEILAQLKELADGMASIHQDVDTLKQASSLQGGNTVTRRLLAQGLREDQVSLARAPLHPMTTIPTYTVLSQCIYPRTRFQEPRGQKRWRSDKTEHPQKLLQQSRWCQCPSGPTSFSTSRSPSSYTRTIEKSSEVNTHYHRMS